MLDRATSAPAWSVDASAESMRSPTSSNTSTLPFCGSELSARGVLGGSYPLTWPPTPNRFPPRSISNFIFWLVSKIWPWASLRRNVCNGVTASPRRSQAYISSRLRNEAYKMCGFTGLNASYMMLALMLPTHPMGLPPVSSSKSAMFEELPEEGERDPAANSRYDGSYTGQNARAEIIPAQQIQG